MNLDQLTICQVLISLDVGGAEILAARIARRLSDRHRFLFACLNELGPLGHRLRDDGFSVIVLDRRPGIDWRAARRLADLVRRERVNVVHAHQYAPFFCAALGRIASRSYPVIMTEHGRRHPDLRSPRRAMVNPWLLRGDDRLVAVGEAVRQALITNDGFPADRIRVVFNGVDLSPFVDAGRDRLAVRSELGIGPEDFVVVQVARLNPIKDHRTALRAFARVVHSRPDAHLLIVGGGEMAGDLWQTVTELGLEASVRFLGSRSDVPRLVGAADLALLTSISEGIPLSLIEAMAAGLPVVSTHVGGIPEVVVEGETGETAAPGDDVGLAESILRLAGDPAARARMGASGRERAISRFSEDRMVAQYDQIYREVARSRPSRGPRCAD